MTLAVLVFLIAISTISGLPLLKDGLEIGIKDCSHVITFKNRQYYVLQESVTIPGIPADININWKTDNIYFTLISNEMKMTLQILYNEDPRRLTEIPVPTLGQSTAVDNVNNDVYLATDSGVYKFVNDSQLEPYAANGDDVMYITVNDATKALYIATFPHNLVLEITNNGRRVETFSAIPNGHGITVDGHGHLYFYTANTAYVLKKNNQVPIKITGFIDDSNKLFFVAKTGKVYAMDLSSRLFLVSPGIALAVYLGNFHVDNVNAFAMDSENNVILGKSQEILKFVVYDRNPCDYTQRIAVYSGEDKQRL